MRRTCSVHPLATSARRLPAALLPVRLARCGAIASPSCTCACGCSGSVQRPPATIEVLSNGVVQVTNDARSAASWSLRLLTSIGEEDDSPLVDPSELVVDSDGRLFVLDQRPAMIRRYAPDGRERAPLAREGSGPGEIRDGGMLLIARDTLMHQDPVQARAQVFLPEEGLIRGWTGPCCLRLPTRADSLGRYPMPGVAVPATEGAEGLFAGRGFLRVLANGTPVDTVAFPVAPSPPVWRGEDERGAFGRLIPFSAWTRFVLDRGGRLIWGNQGGTRLIVSTTGLDTVQVIIIPDISAHIPDGLRAGVVNEMIQRRPGLGAVARMRDVPTMYPQWSSMTVDEDNRIWLLRPGARGPSSLLEVFRADGVLLARLAAPLGLESLDRTFITHERFHAILDDPMLGVAVVRVYTIDERAGPAEP